MTVHKKVCTVEGCGRVHLARGWCAAHYRRWEIHGDPQADVPVGRGKSSTPIRTPCREPGCGYVAPSVRSLAAHRSQAHRGEQDVFVGLGGPSDGWQARAACAGADIDLFFVDQLGDVGPAKQICGGCPVREECLGYALAAEQEFGVWGGMSAPEREAFRRALRRGAA